MRRKPGRLLRLQGFTLIELIMVIVLMGVISVVALPRLFDQRAFSARGFHDETLALLRYAQKAAIAQRRLVCATFSATAVTLTTDADRNAATGANGCEANLTGARGDTPATVTARSPVQYSSVPSTVVFDGLGQPNAAQTMQVAGASGSITVEASTGYVHE